MAESELHGDEMTRPKAILRHYFHDQPFVHVGGNVLLYPEKDNPHWSISPDIYVTKGIPRDPPRDTYRLWEEGLPPTVVIEVTSKKTWKRDLQKAAVYAQLGVAEYYQYDPRGEYLQPPLQGSRLEGGEYRALAEPAAGGLVSEALGLRLVLEAGRLQFYDLASGERLLSPEERAAAEAAQAAAEAARAAAAETRAEAEAARAEAAETRAEAAVEARREAEARLAELRALLRDRLPPAE